MTRLKIIDQQLDQLLQERWKLVNAAESSLPDAWSAAVAGMLGEKIETLQGDIFNI